MSLFLRSEPKIDSYNLPSANPEALALELYLKACKVSYKRQSLAYCYSTSTGDLPEIVWHNEVISGNVIRTNGSQGGAFEYLRKNFADLDQNRSADECADIEAYSHMVRDVLGDCLLYMQWVDEDNYQKITAWQHARDIPFPVSFFLRREKRDTTRANLRRKGVVTMKEVERRARKCYQFLVQKLHKASRSNKENSGDNVNTDRNDGKYDEENGTPDSPENKEGANSTGDNNKKSNSNDSKNSSNSKTTTNDKTESKFNIHNINNNSNNKTNSDSSSTYFFSDYLSSLDVLVASYVALHFHFPGPHNALKDILRDDFPSLVSHSQRILSTHFMSYRYKCKEKFSAVQPASPEPAIVRKERVFEPKPFVMIDENNENGNVDNDDGEIDSTGQNGGVRKTKKRDKELTFIDKYYNMKVIAACSVFATVALFSFNKSRQQQ